MKLANKKVRGILVDVIGGCQIVVSRHPADRDFGGHRNASI